MGRPAPLGGEGWAEGRTNRGASHRIIPAASSAGPAAFRRDGGAPTRSRRSHSDTTPPSHHDQGADPDAQDHRLPPDAHDDAAVAHGVAQRDVELAEAEGADAGLGRRHAPRRVEPLDDQTSAIVTPPRGDGEMAATPR